MSDQPAVGIDLGTTYSVISYLNNDGNPKTALNAEGELTTPSAVFFDPEGVIVGREAVRAGQFEPERLAEFAKRDIGEENFHKTIIGNAFPPEVLEALVLHKLKTDAETMLGEINKAVITVPAYFNEPRRKATQDAGRIAGLDVLDIINEPTAAAIAYGFQSGFVGADAAAKEDERVLVYDLGGGTFDVTFMEIKGSDYLAVATAGDVHLGGIDWDKRIADFALNEFKNQHLISPEEDEEFMVNLFREAGNAKKSLTARSQAKMQLSYEGKSSKVQITRSQFEELTADLLERTRMTVSRVLKDAGAQWTDISRLLLVGGSTRMPMVQKMLEKESGQKADRSMSPDEAVAHGAALYAGVLMKSEQDHPVTISNVNSHDLGVLGISKETNETQRKIMIPRNTRLPAKFTSRFSTAKDGQKNVSVKVVEGGTDSGEGSALIGKCIVHPLPADLPKNTPVEVTFEYLPDGRLNVQAALPDSDAAANIEIQRASGFTEEQIANWTAKLSDGIKLEELIAETKDSESNSNATTSSELKDLNAPSNAAQIAVNNPATVETVTTEPIASESAVEEIAEVVEVVGTEVEAEVTAEITETDPVVEPEPVKSNEVDDFFKNLAEPEPKKKRSQIRATKHSMTSSKASIKPSSSQRSNKVSEPISRVLTFFLTPRISPSENEIKRSL